MAMARFMEPASASDDRSNVLSPPDIALSGALQGYVDGSAPRTGRIHLSPQAADSLLILDRRCVLGLTRSGNETGAHLLENGRDLGGLPTGILPGTGDEAGNA